MEELINLFAQILDNPNDLNTYRRIINFYKKNKSPLEMVFTDLIEKRFEKNGLDNSNSDNK
jgi:hypothetical protein